MRRLIPCLVLVLGISILPLCAQSSPGLPPVPVSPDQIKADQDQIRAVADTLFEDFRNRDAKGAVSCFVSKFPEYYTQLANPNFTPASDSKTPVIDLLIHKAFMTKLAPLVQKSPTLDVFIKNIFNPNPNNVFSDQKASDFIGEIQVNGDSAIAVGKTAIKQMPLEFTFSRENGTWKIDPFPLFNNLEVVIAFDQAAHGRTPEQEADIYVSKMGNWNFGANDPSTPDANKPAPAANTPAVISTPTPATH